MELSFALVSFLVLTLICVVVGGVANGLILWIYFRNKQMPVRTFILILAVLDFYSSVVLMPQMFASYVYDVVTDYVTAPQSVLLTISYDCITATMALDRVTHRHIQTVSLRYVSLYFAESHGKSYNCRYVTAYRSRSLCAGSFCHISGIQADHYLHF